MHNSFPALFSTLVRLFFLVVSFSAAAAGCGSAQYAAGPDYTPDQHDYLRADDSAAYASCRAICSEKTSLALVTRTGCLEGCEEARRSFPLNGRAYSSRVDCLDSFVHQNLAKADRIRELRAWCDANWTHVHNRKGCYRGIDAFYAALEPASICGSDGNDVPFYSTPSNLLREDMAVPSSSPAALDPTVNIPVSESTDVPVPAPKAATARPSLPTGSMPASPFLPPPYVPERPLENSANKPMATPGPLPAETQTILRDTPKYQKIPSAKQASTTSKPDEPVSTENTTPPVTPQPVTVQTTSPVLKPAKPEAPGKTSAAPTPPESPASPSVPTMLQHPATPKTHPPVTPAPADSRPAPSEPSLPAIPPLPSLEPAGSASGESTPLPSIATPQSESPDIPNPETTPSPPEVPTATAPVAHPAPPLNLDTSEPAHEEIPATPVVKEPHPVPPPALPKNTSPAETPEPSDRTQTPTRQGPPMPGLNANRPVPPAPEPSQTTPPALMPPVPSMLNRPYNAPAIIAPQIDIPEEEVGDR